MSETANTPTTTVGEQAKLDAALRAEADQQAKEAAAAAAKAAPKKAATKAPAKKKKPAAKKPVAKKATTPKASKPDENTKSAGTKRPSEYTVKDETHYKQVADKFNFANYRELGAYNGVHNSRYELERGQVIKFPSKPLPGT